MNTSSKIYALPTQNDLLTTKETADYLKMSIGALLRYCRLRRIPHIRLTRRNFRFRRSDLEAWLSTHTT